MRIAHADFTDALAAAGCRQTGRDNWQCPAHDDRNASLSVREESGGDETLFHCHAGCDYRAVMDALDLKAGAAERRDAPGWASVDYGALARQYPYCDENGTLLYTVHRLPGKQFRQQAADGTWSIKGIRHVLYRLPEVLQAVQEGRPVHVVEGEKDTDALNKEGHVATCNSGGAKQWRDELVDSLTGASMVTVWQDKDEPGREWARQVTASLAKRSIPHQVVEAAAGKDAYDHLAAGYLAAEAVPVEGDGSAAAPVSTTAVAGGRELPGPDNPMAVARALLPAWDHDGLPTLRNWRGQWMRWEGPYWAEIDDAAMKADLYPKVEHATFTTVNKEGEPKVIPWAPNRRKVADLLEAVAAVTHLSSSTDAPAWLGGAGNRNVVACRNGILDIRTRELHASTPAFFNLVSSPLDYNAQAPEPTEWLKFLKSLWPDDDQAIAVLQQWFGYVLSGRTDLQKALLLVGERRSGKGTIARVLTALIGKGHVASPTLASMATNFGLSTLIGTPLAIIGDARVPRTGAQQVVERLLSITGEDSLDVDRKYRDPWTGRLPSRIMILSNDLPSFADASGAVASRLVILTLTRSFLGKEDTGLEQRLIAELPSILTWALEGLDGLTQRGRFVEPSSSATAAALLAESVSPIRAFLDECCVKGPEHSVAIKTLYAAWRDWCTQTGRDHPGTEATFGTKLFSAVPALRRTRNRLPDGSRPWAYSGVAIGNTPRPAGCTCGEERDPWCPAGHDA
ncbi:phage/plasmid primase, P4 family [Streptomyces sp. NPDC048370]|uniref:DNA primase family protein n=1 Tax=Streptomyces sp. NPDC048370 TaxID=3365540 RepID=UPI00371E05D2